MTAEGAARLRDELQRLVDDERPPLAADPFDVESRRALQSLDRRIRHLQQSLRTAEIVDRGTVRDDTVRFGCRVRVREESGIPETYRIVGTDETDLAAENISWQSPLAKALLTARVGEDVSVETPRGARRLKVLAVE